MRTHSLPRKFLAGLVLAVSATAAIATAPPTPFTAKYQVLQGGEVIGEATISLKTVGNGEYEYTNRTQGTSGLALALGANTDETTRFRWSHDAPETISYDYRMQSTLKNKQRHLKVDPLTHQVNVDEGKGPISYAGTPGMVDRNTMSYALGLALGNGRLSMTLPVGVRQRVESQQFGVKGTEPVKVPAGSFVAERIERTDASNKFEAWYVPKKFPLPVKLEQDDGGDVTLQLISYRPQ